MKKAKFYYFSNFKANISVSSNICTKFYQKPFFCRPYWILAAILNCQRMPIWHHSDFKSGYTYQLISAKTFSIDAISRSSWGHAGLVIECHCRFKTMTPYLHARDSVMTSLHVTRRTCTPGLTLLAYFRVWESWSTFFFS